MGLIISRAIVEQELCFYYEKQAYSGVHKIADKVRGDISLVFGAEPQTVNESGKLREHQAVIYGTVGCSGILDELSQRGKIDLSEIEGKREVYLFQVVDNAFDNEKKALVIAGSDKRGTIYGLFHLSELLGVSPFVDWCSVIPPRLEEYELEDNHKYVSKEPSVRFRGFFINDEWPAFGNWCTKNFGGFNAKAYEHVFELLLRLKGNYLWPAMWTARFMDDGPGLKNAELADEYGVVMGMSHHEPCLRQGEEYKYLRGKDSVYGDAWNFRTNEKGITKFWEDGLKRSGKFENVITVGMRGEADTAIMGRNATLGDNIELLRDVLKTQNRLIKENVSEDLSKVPRMIALYKEVEKFFYGDEEYKGLMGCEELDDVILMLCDDNFGNLRTLPTEEMRNHPGGYGMYYHFDYHGWPISFEWINSTYLPKVREQMSAAYDFGIRDLWIVNVGDICTQELPLSYFLDLAYDFDKWSGVGDGKCITEQYTREWTDRQLCSAFDNAEREDICDLLQGYTRIVHKRRPEAMNADVYHAVNYNETRDTLEEIERLLGIADRLYGKALKDGGEHLTAFISLVYYPAVGTLNLCRMQLFTTLNHYLAGFGALEANRYISEIKNGLTWDKELIEHYHQVSDGKFFGMGMSEHIGFVNWNEDECQNPVIMQVMPADKPRIRLMVDGTESYAEGSSWRKNRLTLDAFLEPDVNTASFTLYGISDLKSDYKIKCSEPWLTCSRLSGSLDSKITSERIIVTLNRDLIPAMHCKDMNSEHGDCDPACEIITSYIEVSLPAGVCTLEVLVSQIDETGIPKKTFIGTREYISIEAEHFFKSIPGGMRRTYTSAGVADDVEVESEFVVLPGFGKTLSAVKALPTTAYFTPGVDAPVLEYHFVLFDGGEYEAELYMQPSNACTAENKLIYAIQSDDGEIKEYNVIPEGENVGDHNNKWGEGVLNNIRRHSSRIQCRKGSNTLRIFAVTPGFVLEKLVIFPAGRQPGESFLGPKETYFTGR